MEQTKKRIFPKWNFWKAMLRYAHVFILPIITAYISVIFWKCVILKYQLFVSKEITETSSEIMVAYAIIAALVINELWGKVKKVSKAVLNNDKKEFLTQRDEKMPLLFYIGEV